MKKFIYLTFLFSFISCSNNINNQNSSYVFSSDILSSESSFFKESEDNSSYLENTSNSPSTYLKKINIYLNPSVQTHNMYYDNATTEAIMMNKIAQHIYDNLSQETKFNVYINNDYLSLSKSVKEINSLNIDYHLALHSNAGGGYGSECYHHNSYDFANLVLNNFLSMNNFSNRGVKNGAHLYELKNSKAKNKILFEILFHDNKIESEYLQKNYISIAENIANSIKSLS